MSRSRCQAKQHVKQRARVKRMHAASAGRGLLCLLCSPGFNAITGCDDLGRHAGPGGKDRQDRPGVITDAAEAEPHGGDCGAHAGGIFRKPPPAHSEPDGTLRPRQHCVKVRSHRLRALVLALPALVITTSIAAAIAVCACGTLIPEARATIRSSTRRLITMGVSCKRTSLG